MDLLVIAAHCGYGNRVQAACACVEPEYGLPVRRSPPCGGLAALPGYFSVLARKAFRRSLSGRASTTRGSPCSSI
jgi:hypothetical protein